MAEPASLTEILPPNALAKAAGTLKQPQPLVDKHTYYRSKLYSANCALNPLVGAAAPLLSVVDTLKTLEHGVVAPTLSQELIHEIKAFESKAQMREYHTNVIMAARYVLCYCLDEAVELSPWGKTDQPWQNHSLCLTFYQHPADISQLETIINRTLASQDKPTDLMELFYLLLQSALPRESIQPEAAAIKTMCDNLHQAIQLNRKTPQLQLANVELALLPRATVPNKITKPKQTLTLIIAGTLIVLAGVYFSLSLQLHKSIKNGTRMLAGLTQPHSWQRSNNDKDIRTPTR